MRTVCWKIFVVICLVGLAGFPRPVAGVEPPFIPNEAQIQPPIQPADGPRMVAPAPAIPAQAKQLADYLAWDGNLKEFVAANAEPEAKFTFNVTNISTEPVTILKVTTSCGCTTAHLPPMPWTLAPGTNVPLNVTMNLAGKMGVVFKTVTVSTDKGTQSLTVKSTIMVTGNGNAPMGGREANQKMAAGDRQAVFKGDCARCHVEPGVGKSGKELYAAVCGICHEAEHRASMVPDLHNLPHETSRELWQMWIAYGKPGSMMPAFAQSEGGPLTDDQIRSLTTYLTEIVPSRSAIPPQMPDKNSLP